MKPRMSFGRSARNPEEAGDGDRGLDRDELTVAEGEPGISAAEDFPRPADSAPVRPDLGPPAPGPRPSNQPGSGLGLVISVAVAAIVFVLSIYATGSPTDNPLPLAQTTNALFWIVAVVATAIAGAGAEYADRTASRAQEREAGGISATAWIVPTVATAAAIVLVATFHNTTMIVAGPLIAFLGNAGALLSRDLLDDADDTAQRTASTVHTLVIHIVALIALTAIYLNKLPALLTALLVGVVAAVLTIEVIDRTPLDPGHKLLLASLAGGILAASSVPLLWWLTHGLTGGAVLYVVFYLVAGVLQTGIIRRGFRPADAIWYGAVPFGAFILLAVTA